MLRCAPQHSLLSCIPTGIVHSVRPIVVRSYATKKDDAKVNPNQKMPAAHFAKAKSSCKAVGIVGMW